MITFTADTRMAKAYTDDVITLNSVGIPVKIDLSHEFDGLQTTFVFKNGEVSVDLLYNGNDLVLPHEIAAVSGYVYIGCYAANGEGTIVIPTVWASVGRVVKGVEPSGVDPQAPTPSWVAQVQAVAADAEAKADSVVAAAERGDFDGATGPMGPQGPRGEKGDK